MAGNYFFLFLTQVLSCFFVRFDFVLVSIGLPYKVDLDDNYFRHAITRCASFFFLVNIHVLSFVIQSFLCEVLSDGRRAQCRS